MELNFIRTGLGCAESLQSTFPDAHVSVTNDIEGTIAEHRSTILQMSTI